MIKREQSRKDKKVKITFMQPATGKAVAVLGDFNGWNPAKGRLVKRANGMASHSVAVAPGTRVVFRYRSEDGVWFNDEAADTYIANEYGEANSVVIA